MSDSLSLYGFSQAEIEAMRDRILDQFENQAARAVARGSKTVMVNPEDLLTTCRQLRDYRSHETRGTEWSSSDPGGTDE